MSKINQKAPVLTSDFVAPGFEPVREAFIKGFTHRREIGAAFAVYHNNKLVVDLAGGVENTHTNKPFTNNTLQVVFSSTKAIEGICIAMLVDRGLLDFDEPVARYWPEFAQNGKAFITVRQLMRHQAGLVGLDEPITLADIFDLDRLSARLAKQRLFWTPPNEKASAAAPSQQQQRVRQAYHTITRGLYTNELMRRVDGRSMGQFMADEVCKPLGVEFYIGLPPALEHRVSTLYAHTALQNVPYVLPQLILPRGMARVFVDPCHVFDSFELFIFRNVLKGKAKHKLKKAFTTNTKSNNSNKRDESPSWLTFKSISAVSDIAPLCKAGNTHTYHQIQSPSSNGITTALSMARIAAVMANKGSIDGVRLMSPETFDKAMAVEEHSVFDEFLTRRMQLSVAGWGMGVPDGAKKGFAGMEIPDDNTNYVGSVTEFDKHVTGCGGAGGSVCFWSAQHNVGLAYVTNHMALQTCGDRRAAFVQAVGQCVLRLENTAE